MNKLTHALAGAAVAAALSTPAWAGELSMPSSKGIYGYGYIQVMTEAMADPNDPTDNDALNGYHVMTAWLKTAEGSDLYMDLSLVCTLWNETVASSKGGKKETASAENKLKIRIGVESYKTNGDYIGSPTVYPSEVTYCQQDTALSATFQGMFTTDETETGYVVTADAGGDDDIVNTVYSTADDCANAGDAGDDDGDDPNVDADGVTDLNSCDEVTTFVGTCLFITDDNRILLDESCLSPEEVGLVLHTVHASAFNWIAMDVDSGVQKISVYADIESDAEVSHVDGTFDDDSTTSAHAKAILGKIGLWVEEGRLVKGVGVTCDNTDGNPATDC